MRANIEIVLTALILIAVFYAVGLPTDSVAAASVAILVLALGRMALLIRRGRRNN